MRLGIGFLALLVGSCSEQSGSDPCAGVDCSGHGGCAFSGDDASCECDAGYVAQGLECVPEGGSDSDSDSDGDTDTDTDTETDTGSESGSDTGSSSDTDTGSDTGPACEETGPSFCGPYYYSAHCGDGLRVCEWVEAYYEQHVTCFAEDECDECCPGSCRDNAC